jgi:hypothetical protein
MCRTAAGTTVGGSARQAGRRRQLPGDGCARAERRLLLPFQSPPLCPCACPAATAQPRATSDPPPAAACGASGVWCCPSPLPARWEFSWAMSFQTLQRGWAPHPSQPWPRVRATCCRHVAVPARCPPGCMHASKQALTSSPAICPSPCPSRTLNSWYTHRPTQHTAISSLPFFPPAGTFLYVAFMEVIPKELREPSRMPLKLAALLAGFALMSVLAIWA